MHVEEIHSIDDERVAAFAHLTERQLRNKLEPEQGIFIAESPKVIARAVEAGMQAQSFLMERRWLDEVGELVSRAEQVAGGSVPVYTGESEELARLTGFELTRGVLCAMKRPALPPLEQVIHRARRVAILDGLVDHTNVGAAFRSAAALNVDAVLVTPTCCDPLYRRAVRVSMGTVFQVPWTRIGETLDDWPEKGIRKLHGEGFVVVAFALTDEAVSLADQRLQNTRRLAMVFGTEGDGLGKRVVEACDQQVIIPMAHGVDSLNVAAATAVAFWHLCPR